ncbi:hypothetical protein V8C37DRAFT_369131 [Trichoderma ceciliae]
MHPSLFTYRFHIMTLWVFLILDFINWLCLSYDGSSITRGRYRHPGGAGRWLLSRQMVDEVDRQQFYASALSSWHSIHHHLPSSDSATIHGCRPPNKLTRQEEKAVTQHSPLAHMQAADFCKKCPARIRVSTW